MRDLNRIEPTLAALRAAWYAHPNWRLCQLISNLHGVGPQDIFHTEDNVLEQLARAMAKDAS